MKKLLSALFVTMLLSSAIPGASADEILFRGIPWYAGMTEVQSALHESIPVSADAGDIPLLMAIDDFQMVLVKEINGDYAKIGDGGRAAYPSGWLGYCSASLFDLSVAGYPIEDIYIYCSYDVQDGAILKAMDDSKFYLAAYLFNASNVEGAYEDLQRKMNSLYGEGAAENNDYTFFTGDIHIDRSTRWNGDHHTQAVLSHQGLINEDGSIGYAQLWLTYSITDADELIQAICDIQASQERDRIEQNSTDTSGL